jgi:hypothetical protein
VSTSGTAYTGRANGIFSTNDQAKLKQAGNWPIAITAPGAPTINTVTAGTLQVSIAFSAPNMLNGATITNYTVTSSSGETATGAVSPIVITGLTPGTNYTFTVVANSASGNSVASSTSSSVTPLAPPPGQQAYTTPGTYTWIAPAGITSVSAVAVGAGSGPGISASTATAKRGGGGGGGLSWSASLAVVSGQSYTVVVGAAGTPTSESAPVSGGSSSFNGLIANGGNGSLGGTGTKGNGGNGGASVSLGGGGGGGAGGYSGKGGNGSDSTASSQYVNANANAQYNGNGGGGSGGIGGADYYPSVSFGYRGGYGGGVGILGEGASGICYNHIVSNNTEHDGNPGSGGSSNTFGGGGGGASVNNGGGYRGSVAGGNGAVRIIWGTNRAFPSTNTGDM